MGCARRLRFGEYVGDDRAVNRGIICSARRMCSVAVARERNSSSTGRFDRASICRRRSHFDVPIIALQRQHQRVRARAHAIAREVILHLEPAAASAGVVITGRKRNNLCGAAPSKLLDKVLYNSFAAPPPPRAREK